MVNVVFYVDRSKLKMNNAAATSPPITGRLEILDLLRGIAALAVLVYHSDHFLGTQLLPNAYLAVDLFFMLSGFVIAHNYDGKIARGMQLKEFMLHRGIRLFPCYWLALALGLVLATARMIRTYGYVDGTGLSIAAASNLFMLPSLLPLYGANNMFPFNGASWSLMFELIANAIYWLTFRLIRGGTLAALVIAAGVGFVLSSRHLGTVDFGMRDGELAMAMTRVTFSFFVGVGLRRHVHDRWRIRLGPFGILCAVVALLASFWMPELSGSRVAGELAVIGVLYPVLLAGVSNTTPGSRIAGWCKFCGEISYPVYILQTPIMLAFAAFPEIAFHRKGMEWAPYYGVIEVCTVIALSWWTDQYFEWPVRRALKNFLLGGRPASTQPV